MLTTILCGDIAQWQHDLLIPKRYGVDTNIGDTRSAAGIFRALRTIPEMLAICRDIVDSLGGTLVLDNRIRRSRITGLDATVRLPLAGPANPAGPGAVHHSTS